ncbi:alpha/beta hydrolase [Streptomyces sp. TRM 70361]|uniref:alpha/beta hydrolase n=1 Tax=Streptomyces sp. TRM 70361 TaxID=3116553 RepID=UPI002E7B4919|nr:alpha/beta hydrolase [Streptomyces sp. TRM 70361]MEE1943007.1 alpha/beta hydrolase [Streptomyces sp. TRM 70361]
MSGNNKTVGDGALDAQVDAALDAFARGLAFSARSPLLGTPADAGLQFDDVTFPSADGVPLEGWFIPCPGSDKLIICSHPFGFSRYGFPAHLEPWKSAWGEGLGNDFEVNFMPDYKILHDNGYNVLTYDFRNCGLSAAANGGLASNARFESRDVLGSLAYVRSRPELARMTLGLFSRCMGAHATFVAMELGPAAFADVRALVAPLLLSPTVILEQQLERAGLAGYAAEVDRRFQRITSALLAEGSPVKSAPAVTVPTLTYGVHDDPLVLPSDLESIFEAIGAKEKDMFWIHDTIARWDGYLWFQRHPERILEWFENHMR